VSDVRAPGPGTIERCIAAWQRAKAALEADGELAADEQAIAAALDADPNTVTPDELLGRIVRAITFAESREDESKAFVAAMRARQQRYAKRAEYLREELLQIMDALERKSFVAPFATASVRAGTASVLILDEQALPEEYIRTRREPDRTKLLEDLKVGVVIEGAMLSNGAPTIALRRPRALAAPIEETPEE